MRVQNLCLGTQKWDFFLSFFFVTCINNKKKQSNSIIFYDCHKIKSRLIWEPLVLVN